MDKIYIVTTGEYSDYHIVKVFNDKQKAEKYIQLYNQKNDYEYDKLDLEEYDITNTVPEYKDYIHIVYDITNDDLYIDTIRDWDNYYEEKTQYDARIYKDSENPNIKSNMTEHLYLYRKVNSNKSIEEEKQKYIKACYDIAKRINYIQKEMFIFDVKEINKMINSK